MDTHTCDAMATCMNTMGSYECMCNMGYEGDGFMCTGTVPCQFLTPYNNNCKSLFVFCFRCPCDAKSEIICLVGLCICTFYFHAKKTEIK